MKIFDLIIKENLLPTAIEELIPLSFIGTAAVNFYKEKLKLMDRLEVTEKQKKATLKDGQEAGIMLLEIEHRIGELLPTVDEVRKIQGKKQRGICISERNGDTKVFPENTDKKKIYTSRAIKNNPAIVQETIKEAIENDDIPTKTAVLNKIKLKKYEEKHKADEKKKKEMPDIWKVSLDVSNSLTNSFVKLKSLWDYQEHIPEKIREDIIRTIQDLNKIIGESK